MQLSSARRTPEVLTGDGPMIYTGNANPQLAADVARYLNTTLGRATVGRFSDGEVMVEILENVRGRDVYVLQSTCAPTNDHLMEVMIMVDALKRASAGRITAAIPYFGYARQDRRVRSMRVAISAKVVANMLQTAGVDRVLTMDLHAAQIQGFFDVPVDHLYAAPVLNKHFRDMGLSEDEIVIVSPDEGSIKRAIGHAKRLGGPLAVVDKRREGPSVTRQANIIGGPVEGRVALMFDDMITTAGSICGAARVVHEAGAREIHVAATHAVLCGDANRRISESPITSLIVTDTIPLRNDQILPKIQVCSVAPLLAEAIKRIHHDQSISQMFDESDES